MAEKRFQFRDYLTTSNKPSPYTERKPLPEEVSLKNGIVFRGADSSVISHAKEDLLDYLTVCFGIKGTSNNPLPITINICPEGMEDVGAYKGRIIEVSLDGIRIRAFDERGASQALYDLEGAMTAKKQPYLDIGKTKNKPLFAPRLVHSAYGMDQYPAGYLQVLAKQGIDAIMLTVSGVDEVMSGKTDVKPHTTKVACFP
ncbi:MAG: hypothetical protein IJR83_03255 [Clostridia bacterium]|nr:hypothetical protein [Clostridia bacterium]